MPLHCAYLADLHLQGVYQNTTLNLWDAVNLLVANGVGASRLAYGSLNNATFVEQESDSRLRQFFFVAWNSYRQIIPVLQKAQAIMVDRVFEFGTLGETVILMNAALNGTLIILIAVFVVFRLRQAVNELNAYVLCVLASASLPRQ